MKSRTVAVDTAGSAGSASGSSRIGLGAVRVLAIKLNYSDDAPATTDVTIVTDRDMSRTLFTRTSSNADGTFYPRVNAHQTDATAIPAGDNPYEPQVVNSFIEVRVNECDELTDALVATFFYE